MEIQLPYGIKDGALIHISEAERGLACNSLCPACNAPLVARKGSVKQAHFAHASGADCPAATETALHLAAKDVLIAAGKIKLPSFKMGTTKNKQLKQYVRPNRLKQFRDIWIESNNWAHEWGTDEPLEDARYWEVEKVDAEVQVGNVRPDLIAYIQGKPLLIEIAVTHKVDKAKFAKLRKMRLPTLEIDLSSIDRSLSRDDLVSIVIHDATRKSWIYNPKTRQQQADDLRRLRQSLRERRLEDREMRDSQERLIRELQTPGQLKVLPLIKCNTWPFFIKGCPQTQLFKHKWPARDGEPIVADYDCVLCPYSITRNGQGVLCAGASDYAKVCQKRNIYPSKAILEPVKRAWLKLDQTT